MTKVLAAIDGSEHAANALRRAAELFGPTAEYVLVSVIPPWSAAVSLAVENELRVPGGISPAAATHGTTPNATPLTPTAESVKATDDALLDYYRTAQQQARATAGLPSVTHVFGSATPQKRRIGHAICEAGIEHGVEVIVTGSHGSSHTGELMLGSVSQYVLHHATVPVMVVRGG